MFFEKSDLRVMSHTAVTSKFKIVLVSKRTGINLVPLMPDEDKTSSGSLVLDLTI